MQSESRPPRVIWYVVLSLVLFIVSGFLLFEGLGMPMRRADLLFLAVLNSFITLFFVLIQRWTAAKWLLISNALILLAGVVAVFILPIG